MIAIRGKHKKEKQENKKVDKNHKNKLWFKLLICIIVVFIIIMLGYLIFERIKSNKKTEITEKDYQIENIGNIEFENVFITIKDKMSYISIDLINEEKQKILSQEISIKIIKESKEIEYLYKIPDIESGQNYNINLMTTGDLTNIDKIKIEGIEL